MTLNIDLYDSTLRDGTQGANISFSLEDKILVAKKLDELGIRYIEGGFPLSNKKDTEFFKRMKDVKLKQAKVVSFGSTRKPNGEVDNDANLHAILSADTFVVAVVGKGWTVHVKDVLRTTPQENLNIVRESVEYLKEKGKEVVFDCEHFFDGFRDDENYALNVLKAAEEGGADVLVLCDTNGGFLTSDAVKIVRKVAKNVQTPLGIHAHNDTDMAVATSVGVVDEGVTHIQGTINGYGERCGNANLCSIIPDLKIKMKIDCVSDEQLKMLTSASRYIAELANYPHNDKSAYVGRDAFTHKAGQHVDVLLKNKRAMEHVKPDLIGNERRILISELAGKGSVLKKMLKYMPKLDKRAPEVIQLTKKMKDLELKGYEFEAADASFDLIIRRELKLTKPMFDLKDYEVTIVKGGKNEGCIVAGVRLNIEKKEHKGSSFGCGPVDALSGAFRNALLPAYPEVKKIKLVDYKVRVVNGMAGTAAKVRVFVRSTDGKDQWDTVGVSENIVEASWQAIVDSFEYKMPILENVVDVL
ncbi:MAG: citramalate synthase [Candidatus Methanofastidiosia archaeon]